MAKSGAIAAAALAVAEAMKKAQLAPLQFKDYTWPHNPSEYDVKFVKNIAEHQYINISGAEFEDFGVGARIFSGSGVFFGPDAYAQFGALAKVFYDKGPGKLIHPIWQPTLAVFSNLTVKQDPTPFYVEYTFEFMEHRDIDIIKEVTSTSSSPSSSSGSSSGSKSMTHIVKSGESLSYIASLYGLTWRQIANDNKKLVKDPNVLQVGWKLVINNPGKVPSSKKKSTTKTTTSSGKPKPVDDKPQFSDPKLDEAYKRLLSK
jgi:LysM repeat protein